MRDESVKASRSQELSYKRWVSLVRTQCRLDGNLQSSFPDSVSSFLPEGNHSAGLRHPSPALGRLCKPVSTHFVM